jgi:hypothetical protein
MSQKLLMVIICMEAAFSVMDSSQSTDHSYNNSIQPK